MIPSGIGILCLLFVHCLSNTEAAITELTTTDKPTYTSTLPTNLREEKHLGETPKHKGFATTLAACDTVMTIGGKIDAVPLPDDIKKAGSCYGLAGSLINRVINGYKPGEDKTTLKDVTQSLEQIKNQISQLGSRIEERMRELSATVVELSFVTTLVESVNKLTISMNDVFTHPSNYTRKIFIDQCTTEHAVSIPQTIRDRFKSNATNSFVHKMNADDLKSKSTVASWRTSLTKLSLDAIYLAYFYEELNNTPASLKIQHQVDNVVALLETRQLLEKSIAQYTISYWPEAATKAFEKAVDDDKNGNTEEIAKAMKKYLDSINTKDHFLYTVQTTSPIIAGSNAVFHEYKNFYVAIHRSRQWNNFPQSKIDFVKNRKTPYAKHFFPKDEILIDQEKLFVMLKLYASYGVGYIGLVETPSVPTTNGDWAVPGWWMTVFRTTGRLERISGDEKKHTLIFGFV